MVQASDPATPVMGPHRRCGVAALFEQLDGQTFQRYDELIDEVIRLMNARPHEFPIGYGYRDALALAELRGWLATGEGGRSVTVAYHAKPGTQLTTLAA